jgi:hypothetical protein
MGLGIVMGRTLPPIMCTLPEARRILGPITLGYAWGDGTISDLWSRCAPTPDSIPGTPSEKRIISPAHLGEWLEDVLNRQGRPLSDSAQIYMDFMGAKRHGR